MRVRRWQLELAALLVLLTVALYAIRWFMFPGSSMHNEMLRFLVGDIGFLFLQVLLVTVFIDRVFQQREHEEMRQKLNMVVGAFFSEAGTELLGKIAVSDRNLGSVRDDLVPTGTWKPSDYAAAKKAFREHDVRVDLGACDLMELNAILSREKTYLLGLLANQSLLEHEQFTDLLWAITHLAEELAVRDDLGALAPADAAHIAGDVKRAYLLLGSEWIDYLSHLQAVYPYLFSLAVRTNPLDPDAQPVVTA